MVCVGCVVKSCKIITVIWYPVWWRRDTKKSLQKIRQFVKIGNWCKKEHEAWDSIQHKNCLNLIFFSLTKDKTPNNNYLKNS